MMATLLNKKYLPFIATVAVFVAIFLIGGAMYKNFLSMRVLGNILADNSFIIIAAIGTTFVILSGGIDLSIGSMIGFVGVCMAVLDSMGFDPLTTSILMLVFGFCFGAFQGWVIDALDIQPFIITLAGLFLLRGLCFMVTINSVPITHEWADLYTDIRIRLPGKGLLRSSAIVMLISLVVAIFIAHFTRFGSNVYAIGGDKESARLMGVNVRRTTVLVYATGGIYAALAGIVYALYTKSGYPLAGSTLELSAIAAVVLGGTLLTGGVGMVAGTLFGGMILGLISTLIIFNGSLNSAWILISSGVLLFAFIVMHRFLVGSFHLRD
ncbi:galactofuranose ABC transporter, permease protein YjfF [Thalassococcus sp. BH17M4-6]|uniref:galactofuranose ABC transporter, permease protein YjfF n=1 Tax=Thalassococcus sp. BH17M4-6 TaxID=3413148 RepID=UPI003BEA9522